MKNGQIFEAIERLGILTRQGLHVNVVRDFSDDNLVYKSERQTMRWNSSVNEGKMQLGVLYHLEDEEIEIVNEFESKYKALIYLVEKSNLEFGTCLTFFYVSAYSEEWELEKQEMIDSCIVCSYVKNLDDDMCSEFGSIMYELGGGGLLRIS